MTRVWVKLKSFDQGRHKNDAFTLLATLTTTSWIIITRTVKILAIN